MTTCIDSDDNKLYVLTKDIVEQAEVIALLISNNIGKFYIDEVNTRKNYPYNE